MSRVSIVVSIPDVEDEVAIEVKKAVEEVVKEVEGAAVNMSIGPTVTPLRPAAA